MTKITNEVIEKALYQKYIEPTKHKTKRCFGIEIEMPIINLNKKPVELDVVFETARAFAEKFGFKPSGFDDNGFPNAQIDEETGDELSFDCCYSNLELSMGKADDLFEIKNRYEMYYSFLNEYFGKFNYTLSGMGINPYYNIHDNQPVPNERYRMLYHYLHSYKEHKGVGTDVVFHDHPDFATFTSASQVQIDVGRNVVDIINVFGKIEPYKSVIFANSYLPERPDLMCSRNMLWEHSMQGYNPHNIGMFDEDLKDEKELIDYIKTTSIYCTMRKGKYIDFTPIKVSEYFQRDKITGQFFNGKKYEEITFEPCLDDLQYLRTFKFEDLTFRGTVEFRSCCCQPVSESMTIGAFHMGLLENFEELKKLTDNDNVIYNHGYNALELQKLFSCRELPEFVDKKKLSEQIINILDISKEGLKKRGFGEEKLLKPLYSRAEKLESPALKIVRGLENGEPIEKFISLYGSL